MRDLNRIDESLDKLQADFNSQLQAIDADTKTFHNALIDLSAKYPDHKELLQFIVFVNDKLETNQNIFSEVLIDSFNELIKSKKELIHTIKESKENDVSVTVPEKKGFFKTLLTNLDIFKDFKIILASLAVILLVIGALFAPDTLISILKALAGIVV